MVEDPVFPALSVTRHVCSPESIERSAHCESVADISLITKQSPEQVEVHWYVNGSVAPSSTTQIRVTGVAARYAVFVDSIDTVRVWTE